LSVMIAFISPEDFNVETPLVTQFYCTQAGL
jgi:hypothetical protein